MRLAVTTPLSIIIETNDVAHLRAEDETGAFGILPRHADFLTALSVSVISWRDQAGAEHHLAVRGGVLEVDNDENRGQPHAPQNAGAITFAPGPTLPSADKGVEQPSAL